MLEVSVIVCEPEVTFASVNICKRIVLFVTFSDAVNAPSTLEDTLAVS
jgi:hypothetical protein